MATTQSPIEHFIDSFFHEKNIRWMLVVGATIVFGSSLMLVTREWSHWPMAAQFMTILGYTAATYGFAELSRRRLGLTTTANVLNALTLLLLPVSFLSLSWLTSHSLVHQGLATVETIGLLIPATLLTWFASTRIFDEWLRARQPTFVIAYLVLCVAGALPVLSNPWLAAITSFSLWLVITAGIVKVNRHVFWMIEEYRAPRAFGFLPIGLLGAQFMLLMGTKTWRAIPSEWFGFGCVAIAATVLLTVRSIAHVYRQRTGDLVRPLPWNITVPLLTGIILTAIGVLISFHGFSYLGSTTYAVVPTTFLSAFLMMIVAKETRHQGFVWSALILATVAYQTTPSLASDFVQLFKDQAAHAFSEERLPLAFYGLTYVPLLLVLAFASRFFSNRKETFISKPMQYFATLIAFALFGMSFSHPKAICLVALVNVCLFICFAILFRDRRYSIPALASLSIIAASWILFENSMHWFSISPIYAITSLGSLACFLVATRFPDRLIQRIPSVLAEEQPTEKRIESTSISRESAIFSQHVTYARDTGLLLTFFLSMAVVGYAFVNVGMAFKAPQLVSYIAVSAAVFLSTIRTRHYTAGLTFWIVAIAGVLTWLIGADFQHTQILSGITFVAAAVSLVVSFCIQWLHPGQRLDVTLAKLRNQVGVDLKGSSIWFPGTASEPSERQALPNAAPSLAFVLPLGDLGFVVAISITAFLHLPFLVGANVTLSPVAMPVATSVMIGWMLVVGLFFRNTIASIATLAILPIWASAMTNTLFSGTLSHSMLPLVWSLVAGAIVLILNRMRITEQKSIRFVGIGWLSVLLALSFFHFDLPLRASGAVSLAVLSFVLRRASHKLDTTILAILANMQLLLATMVLGGMRGWIPLAMNSFMTSDALPWLLPVFGLSILLFDRRWPALHPLASRLWAIALRTFLAMGILSSFVSPHLQGHQIGLVLLGIGIAATTELCEAVRRQREGHVWSGIALIGISLLWLAHHGLIVVGAGMSQIALLAIAVAALVVSNRLRGSSRFSIFVRPLAAISLTLPGMIMIAAVGQQLLGRSILWSGLNTLAMLSSAAIYFHHGLTTKQAGYHVAAAGIVNVTLALLWHSMQLYDFQLYLVPLGLSVIGVVELLKKDLHHEAHDPIRYVGALTILVSPIFRIMNGSWWHLLSLMVLSVVVILLAIGLRTRVLIFTGTAFLAADMVAMIVRTTIDHPSFLWMGGLAIGVGVIALAAICERHREQLLAKIRLLSSELATWN